MHKVEQLREQDEDLVKDFAHNRKLEASLKMKEDKLESSRGVTAENADLQAMVASLTAELGMKLAEIGELKNELNVSVDGLAAVFPEVAVLEGALRICRLEWTQEKETSAHKVAGLEGRVKEFEAELSLLTCNCPH